MLLQKIVELVRVISPTTQTVLLVEQNLVLKVSSPNQKLAEDLVQLQRIAANLFQQKDMIPELKQVEL